LKTLYQPRYLPAVNTRRSLVFVLSGAILLLTAIAYASEVDPGWGGIYDADDGDDAILLIAGNIGAVEPAPPPEVDRWSVVVAAIAIADPAGHVSVSLSLSSSRAPPAP
jgi:hypothetical protein